MMTRMLQLFLCFVSFSAFALSAKVATSPEYTIIDVTPSESSLMIWRVSDSGYVTYHTFGSENKLCLVSPAGETTVLSRKGDFGFACVNNHGMVAWQQAESWEKPSTTLLYTPDKKTRDIELHEDFISWQEEHAPSQSLWLMPWDINDMGKVLIQISSKEAFYDDNALIGMMIYDLKTDTCDFSVPINARRLHPNGPVLVEDGLWTPEEGMLSINSRRGFEIERVCNANKVGQIVGWGTHSNGDDHGFFLNQKTGAFHAIRTILNGDSSVLFKLNQKGQAIGWANTGETEWVWFEYSKVWEEFDVNHAIFFDERRKLVDLGTLRGKNSEAEDINDEGVVVGNSEVKRGDDTHAFVWDTKNGMRDLNHLIPPDCGCELLKNAEGITNSGMIICIGTINGNKHIFKLIPHSHK